jgi:hypothetical protein
VTPFDDQRVAGIMAALKANHDVGPLAQPVDDLTLALIAPLRADHGDIGHAGLLLLPSASAPRLRERAGVRQPRHERRFSWQWTAPNCYPARSP